MASHISSIFNVFSGGLTDICSIFLPISLLLDSYIILQQVATILMANTILVCGVILIYSKYVTLMNDIGDARSVALSMVLTNKVLTNQSWTNCFHIILILLIVIYCQVSAPWKYQQLAEEVLRYLKRTKKTQYADNLVKYVSSSSYGLLAWICVFLQVHLFSSAIPIAISYVAGPFKDTLLIKAILISSQLISDIISCALHAWYCFDGKWIAEGLNPDERFAIIQKNWPYYLGFGLPFVLNNKISTGFWGYGIFMAYFPFAIMIATCSNHSYYSSTQVVSIPELQIFKSTQFLASRIMSDLERKRVIVADYTVLKEE